MVNIDNEHIGRNIKIIHHYITKQLNNDLLEINLTRTQIETLVCIKIEKDKDNEINQVDIQRMLNMKNPTVTGILNRLEEKGYIKREKSCKDKRYKRIVLTDDGEKLLEDGKNKALKREKELSQCLTENEIKQLSYLLEKIIENLRR